MKFFRLLMKIYLDVCCLNRPFDDLTQERIKLEAEAINMILNYCKNGLLILINSDGIEFETAKNIDNFKIERVRSILSLATIYIDSSEMIKSRAKDLMKLNFKFYDALHLAFAEAAEADIFLTTDDRLFRRAKQYSSIIKIPVDNPVSWLINLLQSQGDHDEIK